MNHLAKSKWTSIKKINGWKHYEVLNFFKKDQKVEMFSVCENSVKIVVSISDLKDRSIWIAGWIGNPKQ